MKKGMKKYTVVGLYESEGEILTHHVTAPNTDSALIGFAVIMQDDENEDHVSGVSVVAVFEGHLENVYPNCMATFCDDILASAKDNQ